MSSFDVKFDFTKFQKFLDKLDKEVEKKIEEVVTNSTENCEANAKVKVPVDTGALRESIHHEVKHINNAIVGEVSTKHDYCEYVEYGTGQRGEASNTNPEVKPKYRADWKGMKAQPYMYPAFVSEKDKFIKNCENILKEVCK